jgi:hypothetical protein
MENMVPLDKKTTENKRLWKKKSKENTGHLLATTRGVKRSNLPYSRPEQPQDR